MTATYFQVQYDTQAGGEYTTDSATELTWTGGGRAQIVTDTGGAGTTTGQLSCVLIAGAIPTNTQTMTQGGVTADANGNAELMLYPAYFREDTSLSSAGLMTWTGPALGATHSFFFDGDTGTPGAGDIVTFTASGQTAEIITVETDAGATGEVSVRWIDTVESLPGDNAALTWESGGGADVAGVIHDRAYTPLHLHRLLADLNDDEDISGNDDLSRIDPTPSDRSTDQIITLLSVQINDEIVRHMYGGSVTQEGGDTLYSGLDVQVTSPNAATVPLVIQYSEVTGAEAFFNSATAPYWGNGYMGDPVAGGVRIMIKTRSKGVDIDGRRVRGALLEYGDFYFFGGTTIGTASTALALFSSTDGNNQTDVGEANGNGDGTIDAAPYTSVVLTEGFQNLDYNNGNGATPFSLQVDIGSATKDQAYERTKYVQKRGTALTLYGRNAGLILGVNRDLGYDNRLTALFLEDNEVAWGTRINYDTEVSGPFITGEPISFVGSGALGRIILLDDDGTSGVLIVEVTSGTPVDTDTLTTLRDGGDTTANVTTSGVTLSSVSGTGLILAEDDSAGTGNLYYQALYGSNPVDNTILYSLNAGSLVTADVTGAVNTRTINNQFVGNYTGSDFQTNFGIGLDPNDAQVNDQLRNLLDAQQSPPNNQSGTVTDLVVGDVVTVYPWDGSTLDVNGDAVPEFAQMTITADVTSGVSTTITVNAIPDNTPASGFIRYERTDAGDGNYQLQEYASFSGSVFTLVGTALFTVTSANTPNAMVAYVDEVVTGTSTSFTSVFASTKTMTVTVRRGGASPIKTFKSNPTFGSTGFSVGAVRTSDA